MRRYFIPTMGALHEGHLSLIKMAAATAEPGDEVAISIFVNPLQFENQSDLEKYPRDLARDRELAMAAGATRIWAPSYDEVFPETIKRFGAGDLGEVFEGRTRTGHFAGVLTVVNRLFEVMQPDVAIFGEKDFQQLFLIRRFAAEYFPDIEIWPGELIRDHDGLALSSRNVRLSAAGRQSALAISKSLREISGITDLALAREELKRKLSAAPGFTLDYAELIDESNFQPATNESGKVRAIVAGLVEGVRLLDNMPLGNWAVAP